MKKIDPEKSLVYSMGVLFDGVADQRTKIEDPEILSKKCHRIEFSSNEILKNIEFIDQMKDKVVDKRPTLDEVLEYNWKK